MLFSGLQYFDGNTLMGDLEVWKIWSYAYLFETILSRE